MDVSCSKYHRELSSIRKWVLSLGGLSVWPSLAADVFPGFCWPFNMYIHFEVFIHALRRNLNRALIFLYFTAGLLQAQNIEREVHFLSLLDSQFFVHYRCRQTGVWVGSFWPYFSIGHALQLCFSFLWLELITAASPMQHEREESWRYLSVVVENKMRKQGKEDRIAFWVQWLLSE